MRFLGRLQRDCPSETWRHLDVTLQHSLCLALAPTLLMEEVFENGALEKGPPASIRTWMRSMLMT